MARPSDEFRRRLESWQDARSIGDELEAEITGRFKALADDRETPTDPARKPQSDPPPKVAKGIVAILRELPPGQRLLGLFVLVGGLVGALTWGGGKLAGLW